MLVTNILDMSRWDRTHEALLQAALELFEEYGYDATGTAQIARHAGVSEMTLFRHFPSKEALLLTDPFDPLIADAVRARPNNEPPMRALAGGIRQTLGEIDPHTMDALRRRLAIVVEAGSLEGAFERNSTDTIAALVAALEDRGNASVDARIAATAMVSGLGVALAEWARHEHLSLPDALDSALDVLGGA